MPFSENSTGEQLEDSQASLMKGSKRDAAMLAFNKTASVYTAAAFRISS